MKNGCITIIYSRYNTSRQIELGKTEVREGGGGRIEEENRAGVAAIVEARDERINCVRRVGRV